MPAGVDRELAPYELTCARYAAEHAYIIYNRRFHEIQIITVYAVAVDPETADILLNPVEHSEYQWVSYETALDRVHYRGLSRTERRYPFRKRVRHWCRTSST